MRGYLNIRENRIEQERLQREAAAFSRTKANSNTPWPRPVKAVTYGEWQDREKEAQ
jgi:hypothetical protein